MPYRDKEKQNKSAKRFRMSEKGKEYNKRYQKIYYMNHRDEAKKRASDYRKNNLEKVTKYMCQYHHNLRMKIFALLGGKCANSYNLPHPNWCNNLECLQIDHINGGGRKHIASFKSYVEYLRYVSKHPEEFQLLCANCNQIKRYRNCEDRRIKIDFNYK